MNPNKYPIIAALDNLEHDEILPFINNEIPEVPIVKLGLELFNAYGKALALKIERDANKEYFLDLKLHDIPNTVYQAIKGLSGLNPLFLTIHLTGGTKMIEQALLARDKYLPKTKVLGVSYLTSLSLNEMHEIWGKHQNELLTNIINLAKKTAIDGVVCSAADIQTIKELTKGKIIVTPGIRISGSDKQDQKRVMSPQEALKQGSDFLVIGRPLRDKKQKTEIFNQVKKFYRSQ